MSALGDKLAAALAYAQRGWPVLPLHWIEGGSCSCRRDDCHSPGKHPRTEHGVHDASRDPTVIRQWWQTWPLANVGIATGPASNLFVPDIDPRSGGRDTFEALERELGELPETVTCETGGRGVHYYFSWPAGEPNLLARLGPGVDLQGAGKYVLAPPSVHASGAPYVWRAECAPGEIELATLPERWREVLVRVESESAAEEPMPECRVPVEERIRRARACTAQMPPAIAGRGGHRATWAVAIVIVRGFLVPRREALEILGDYSARCRPPWSEKELLHKLKSAQRARVPWGYLLERDGSNGAGPTDGRHDNDADSPGDERQPPLVRRLADIWADPAVLEPPAVVVPRLAWRGRVTLLAAPEKIGKSTLATACAAGVSRGLAWLGDPTAEGRVLWVGLEEHVGDLASRMHNHGARGEAVYVIESLATEHNPIAAIRERASTLRPALIVVDTLAALVEATGTKPEPGSSTAWTPIMSALTRIARETDAAVVLLHHARRSDGHYRDSSAIGAGVDVIIEMAEGQDLGVRSLRVRARWRVGDYTVRLVGETYELGAGELSLDVRVLLYVEAHPGCSQRAAEQGITARAADVRAAIHRLLGSGALIDCGTGGSMRLYPAGRQDPDATGTHSGMHSDADPGRTGRSRAAGGTQADAPAGRTLRPASEPQGSEPGRTAYQVDETDDLVAPVGEDRE